MVVCAWLGPVLVHGLQTRQRGRPHPAPSTFLPSSTPEPRLQPRLTFRPLQLVLPVAQEALRPATCRHLPGLEGLVFPLAPRLLRGAAERAAFPQTCACARAVSVARAPVKASEPLSPPAVKETRGGIQMRDTWMFIIHSFAIVVTRDLFFLLGEGKKGRIKLVP